MWPALSKALSSSCAPVILRLDRPRSSFQPQGLPRVDANASERCVQFVPQLRGALRLIRGHDGEVAADAVAQLDRRAQLTLDVIGDPLGLPRDHGAHLLRRVEHDRAELAGDAQRALLERWEALEVADDLVAPGLLALTLLGARLLADHGALGDAEHMAWESGEVVALEDEVVVGVDLAELAAAAAPHQQVHHDVGPGHEQAVLRVVARDTEGAGEVVTPQQFLPHGPHGLARQKPRGDQEHAHATGHEQVEGATHEIREGPALFVKFVGVLEGHRPALAVGRIAQDQVNHAAKARRLLMDPPLEGHLEVRGIGANGAQQPATHARELDRRPLHALDLAAPLKRQAALCR
jgi:hypothetical protein